MDNLMSGLGFSRKKSFDEEESISKEEAPAQQEHDNDFDLSDDTVIGYSTPPVAEVEEEQKIEAQEDTPVTQAAHQEKSESAPLKEVGVGPKIFIRGEIIGEEDLLIQGKVEGSIDLSGHHLTIGVNGAVIANVKAKIVTVEGNVAGDVSAEELIEIKASSQIKGNLICERVVLEDGARFRGSIDMSVDELADEAPFKSEEKDGSAV